MISVTKNNDSAATIKVQCKGAVTPNTSMFWALDVTGELDYN